MHRIIDGELSAWRNLAMERCEKELDINSEYSIDTISYLYQLQIPFRRSRRCYANGVDAVVSRLSILDNSHLISFSVFTSIVD